MKTLMIKDMSLVEELDRKAMAGVHGGYFCGWTMPTCFPTAPVCYPAPPSYGCPTPSTYTSTTSVTVAQANNQYQNNPTGNGSAVFGGGISAQNNQQGYNII